MSARDLEAAIGRDRRGRSAVTAAPKLPKLPPEYRKDGTLKLHYPTPRRPQANCLGSKQAPRA
jgi:hypothetical protein